MNPEFVEVITRAARQLPGPLVVPWPARGRPDAIRTFTAFGDWRDLVLELRLRDTLPQIVTAKYQRALKLDLMVGLTTLELALKDRSHAGPEIIGCRTRICEKTRID